MKHRRTGREFLNFSHVIIQRQSLRICSTLRISVPGGNVIINMGYLVRTELVALSVLVSWEIRATGMLSAIRSVRTSSLGTLGGIPLSTSRG